MPKIKQGQYIGRLLFILGMILIYFKSDTWIHADNKALHCHWRDSQVSRRDKNKPGDMSEDVNLRGNDAVEACRMFPHWSFLYPIPFTTSDLSNWDFTRQINCPKLEMNQEKTLKQKVIIDCSVQPTMSLVPSENPSDVLQVEFGNTCLQDVIDNCCSDSQPVPNVVHYVWYSNQTLGYFNFLSYISAMRFMRPCLFLFHGESLPHGPYWDLFRSLNPNVIHVRRKLVTSIYGHTLAFKEHGSDVMRIEALITYGGVYLDWDEVLLRPLEPLRQYEYTQGLAGANSFGSQVIMATRNATFLNLWHQGYKNYSKVWGYNALYFPFKIWKKYPHLVHVEGHNFTKPGLGEFQWLFEKNYDWTTNYAMHLYIRFYKKPIDFEIIRSLNNTIGAVSRHILFGNKELCMN